MGEIQHGKFTEEGDNHRVEKISQRFIDSIASTNGVVLLKKVECVVKNDCQHVKHCNILCIRAFIKHYCYIRLRMGQTLCCTLYPFGNIVLYE